MSFDAQPTFADAVVALRPLVAADWNALYAVAADPLIWAGHPAHDRWQEPVFREFFAEALASGGALAAIDPATGAIIGSSRFERQRAEPGEVEVGWTFLARAAWRTGVNAAMKRLMVAHALAHFDRVLFSVGENNGLSRRALEKIGATPTGRSLHSMRGGQSVLHLIYAIDRAGFAAGPLLRGR